MSRGELDREDGARGDTFRPAWAGTGLLGEVGQERPGGAWTGLWLPSESLPWELGGVGGICSDSRPDHNVVRKENVSLYIDKLLNHRDITRLLCKKWKN